MQKRFPQYLSSPFQVVCFESDTVGVIVLFFALAMLFGSWFWLSVLVCPYGYCRLKGKYPRGFLKHTTYFCGLLKMKGYPQFFIKRFIS
jgi:type IV conjugative transfer system protein TraL